MTSSPYAVHNTELRLARNIVIEDLNTNALLVIKCKNNDEIGEVRCDYSIHNNGALVYEGFATAPDTLGAIMRGVSNMMLVIDTVPDLRQHIPRFARRDLLGYAHMHPFDDEDDDTEKFRT